MSEDFNKNNENIPDEKIEWQNPYIKNSEEYTEPVPVYFDQNSNYNKEEPPKKNSNGLKVFLTVTSIILSVLLVTSIVFFIGNLFNKNSNLNNSSSAPMMDLKDATEEEGTLTAQEVYKKAVNSIVGIVVYDSNSGPLSGSKGQGSGIIMSADGYIVTNAHVIDNSKSVKVSVVIDSDHEYDAKIVGFDSRTDIAVLKIEANSLTPAEFGNSDQVSVGSWVMALGNPGGLDFANSLTRGIVSAVNRPLSKDGMVKYIQTDAAINAGNSGGALLDMHGRVIGVNSCKVAAEGFEGMGFAIPSKTVREIFNNLSQNGYVGGRACLGIKAKAVSAYEAQSYNVPQGILIAEISQGSNMTEAGAKNGDIITAIDGKNVLDPSGLYKVLSDHKVGDTVTLKIYRINNRRTLAQDAQTLEIQVKLVEDKGSTVE